MSCSKSITLLLIRDRQIPTLRGEFSAGNGDLAIPVEQNRMRLVTLCNLTLSN